MISFKVVGRGKGGVSDFNEKQRLFSSKVYCVVVRSGIQRKAHEHEDEDRE